MLKYPEFSKSLKIFQMSRKPLNILKNIRIFVGRSIASYPIELRGVHAKYNKKQHIEYEDQSFRKL